ncbi:MAG TPA: carbohydrate ABC transporter permease [Phototrophicaceae bacterium]|nr:carbohydrate ABC transporter permease [Phototrophicaceae bacterium]
MLLNNKTNKLLQGTRNNLIAIFACLLVVIPVYLVVVNSLKDSAGARTMSAALPQSLHFENFNTVIERGKLAQTFQNSMLYATSATVISSILASMAAYVLSRNKSRLNRFVYFFVVMGIAMPMNFFTLTKIMQLTHLINTQVGIIILYAATQIPFNIFLIYGFVDAIPRELDEAAIIDGCGPYRLFFWVIFPLLVPVIVTAGVLSFVGIWNDFLLPLYYLNNSAYWPMTLAVYNFFGQFQQDWNLVSADIVLTVLPVLIIYLLGQRFILSGLTAGAVKG